MSAIIWDKSGEKLYETGTKKGVLYPAVGGNYPKGYGWNGLISVSENPGGAEANDMWADDIKYASLRSAETFAATIEAYMYPEEFAECDGSAAAVAGVYLGQQSRKPFGFSYVTQIGSDQGQDGTTYKLHLIYGLTASPSEKSYQTINDSPEALTFSWETESTPVNVTVGDGKFKPVSTIVIDSTKCDKEKLEALEKILYGSEEADPRLPLPDEVLTMMGFEAA